MNEIVRRGLKTGVTLATATTVTMGIASIFKSGSPWAGINAMASAAGVGGRRPRRHFASVATPVGLTVLTGGMLLWGIGYEAALAKSGKRSSALTGAVSALAGYVLDRFILPDQLQPNFHKTMGRTGTFVKYIALGTASATSDRLINQIMRSMARGGGQEAGAGGSQSAVRVDDGARTGADGQAMHTQGASASPGAL